MRADGSGSRWHNAAVDADTLAIDGLEAGGDYWFAGVVALAFVAGPGIQCQRVLKIALTAGDFRFMIFAANGQI